MSAPAPVMAKAPPMPVATPPAPPPKPRAPRKPFKVILRERLAKLPRLKLPTAKIPKLPAVPKLSWKAWLATGGAVVVFSFMFLCLGGASFLGFGNKGVKPNPNVKKKVVEDEGPSDPLLDITARTLFKAYQENVLRADDMYKGKELYLLGDVDSVDRTESGTIYVYLVGGRYELTKVRCMIDGKYRDDVADLTRGARIRVKGTCEGKSTHVILSNCKVLKD